MKVYKQYIVWMFKKKTTHATLFLPGEGAAYLDVVRALAWNTFFMVVCVSF